MSESIQGHPAFIAFTAGKTAAPAQPETKTAAEADEHVEKTGDEEIG